MAGLGGRLRSTTMLYGVVGATFLSVTAYAGDPSSPYTVKPITDYAPAVDGINAKVEPFGGSLASKSIYGSQGAFSVPLTGPFGAQIDAAFGSFDNRPFRNIAGHFFWRSPANGLVGLYTSYTAWDQFGGVYVGQVAGEGEYYSGRWTVQGIAGVEYGNHAFNTISSTSTVAPGPLVGGGLFVFGPPGVTTASTFTTMYDVRTRFFDQINLKYYLTDNWSGYVGHRYLGGMNALALGTEYAIPLGKLEVSAFVEARAGEGATRGIWGGLKFYLGQKDKPLIARQRQDDPTVWSVDTLFSIVNSMGSSGSSSSTTFCTPPATLLNNGTCEAFNPNLQ